MQSPDPFLNFVLQELNKNLPTLQDPGIDRKYGGFMTQKETKNHSAENTEAKCRVIIEFSENQY